MKPSVTTYLGSLGTRMELQLGAERMNGLEMMNFSRLGGLLHLDLRSAAAHRFLVKQIGPTQDMAH